jgi:hypothetical protein
VINQNDSPPFDLAAFKAEVANPALVPSYLYIALDQCNDQHGAGGTIRPGSGGGGTMFSLFPDSDD